jgi:hypothetical protein
MGGYLKSSCAEHAAHDTPPPAAQDAPTMHDMFLRAREWATRCGEVEAERDALAERVRALEAEREGLRELIRRLYVELLWCDRQLTGKGATQGATVRAALDDSLAYLNANPKGLPTDGR